METQPRVPPFKKWWVFFVKTDIHRNWWYKLIPSYKPPFQHCYAACEVTNNLLMFFDPQMNGCVVSLMQGRPTDHIKFVLRGGGRVLYVERMDWLHDVEMVEGVKFRRGWTITCASFIAFHMGLNTRLQTPRALFDFLVQKHNALELRREHGRWWRRGPQQAARSTPGADPGGRDRPAAGAGGRPGDQAAAS